MKVLQFIRESIKRKIILLFVTVILFIASTVGIVQYVLTSSMLQLDLEKYSKQMLEQANLNINRYFKEYEQAFLFIEGSDEFYQWTRQQDRFTSTYLRLYNLVYQNSVQPFVMQHPEVVSISLLNSYGNELRYNPVLPFKLGYSLAERVKEQPVTEARSTTFIVKRSTDYEGKPIVVLTLFKKLDYYGNHSYIQMDISVKPILNILERMNDGSHNSRYIIDSEGTIVAHPVEEAIFTSVPSPLLTRMSGMESGAFLDPDSRQFVVFASIPDTPGWKSVIEVPYKEAARTIYLVRDVTLTVTGIGIGVTVLMLFIMTSSMTRRIVLLKKQLLSTKIGHFAPGPEVGGIDEIAHLGHAFNDMLARMDASIDELAHTRAREQIALFTAVQSQIHSHFLYNSLETINAMASLSGMKPIEDAVVSLSSMIRYSSRIRDITVTLRDEIEHTKHYLNMACIRFESITYNYKTEAAVLSAHCPKLILQPVLENAIKHNLEKYGRSIHIDISMRSWFGRYVRICIRDNGAGIPQAELFELRERISRGSLDIPEGDQSIGLPNIAYRIKQFYKRYGLQAEIVLSNCRSGNGVKVHLILPILPA